MTTTKRKIVFLTGAGMSVESGLSTFRGAGGLWDEYPVEQVASHEGWERNPDLVNHFYNIRRKQLFAVEPNEGHRLIASLEKQFDVTVITQNIDDLHERAGSTHVLHLHGELKKVCSSRDPDNPYFQQTLTPQTAEVAPGTRAGDGSLLRPFVVFFGEAVPMMYEAERRVEQADVLVVIGTSLNVYPAANLIHNTRARVPIYIIDPEEVPAAQQSGITHLNTGASEGMRQLIALLHNNL